MRSHRFAVPGTALLVAVIFATPLSAQEPTGGGFSSGPRYRQIEIPGIPEQGFVNVFPADINNHGVIVGAMNRLPGFVPVRAFLWNGGGPTQDLGDLGLFELAYAVAINDANQVIGNAEVPDARDPLGHVIQGFYWENGVIRALPPLGGDAESRAVAINELGEVLVASYDDRDPRLDRYYVWSAGRVEPIGRLAAYPGGPAAFAASMNDVRQIVGSVVHADGVERAFLWEDGRMTDLGFAPGDDFFSMANRIGNDGTILGESWAFDDLNGHGARSQGVVWRDAALLRTIAPLPGGFVVSPFGVNASGTVVGFSGFPSSAIVSFGEGAIDLNTLVRGSPPNRFLYQATDVNDRGQIVVDGQFGCCGYLLQPE